MSRQVLLTTDEITTLEQMGGRIRRARLRRNLSQAGVAERAGVTRKLVVSLEGGQPSVSLGALARVLSVLGYPNLMAGLLGSDPIGEDLEEVHGRQRAGRRERSDVEDF